MNSNISALALLPVTMGLALGCLLLASPQGTAKSSSGAKHASMPFSLSPHTDIVNGIVVELQPAGSYTYFQLENTAAGQWFVCMGQGPTLGQDLVVTVYGSKSDFESRRLNRTFPELGFARWKPSTHQPQKEE